MARNRKKRPTIRGNLIKVGLVFAAGAAVAVLLPLLGGGYQPLVPELHDPDFQAEARKSPDNAYHLMVEAENLLPETSDALRSVLHDGMTQIEHTVHDRFLATLRNFLGVADGTGSGEMRGYLSAAEPAVAKAREALHRPYYLAAEPPTLAFRRRSPVHAQVWVAMLGRGAMLTGDPATLRGGLEILLDTARLGRRVWPEEQDIYFGVRGVEAVASSLLCVALPGPGIEEHLPWLLSEWKTLGTPLKDRMPLLQAYWRNIDNTMLYRREESVPFGRQVELTLWLMQVQSWADNIRRHHEPFLRMAAMPPAGFGPVLQEYPRIGDLRRRDGWYLHWNLMLLRQAAVFNTHHARTLVAIALELHHHERGGYPETLSALTPDYLDPLPADPVNGLPFAYETGDAGYTLHSAGLNEQYGDDDDYLVLNLFNTPE